MKLTHGGDIYGYEQEYGKKPLDFSANINPLGVPEGVKRAMIEAAETADRYPDPLCRRLTEAISKTEQVDANMILCGNGAADLIFRIVLAVKPAAAGLLCPSFAEYEQALQTVDCTVHYFGLEKEKGFVLEEDFFPFLDTSLDILFLCNPNNPTGDTIGQKLLVQILEQCKRKGILLVLDECFVDFLDEPSQNTMKKSLAQYQNLIILRAFTKLYGMAGVRLGYCMCSDAELLSKVRQCGQPWAVSSLAQEAGIAALQEQEYVQKTKRLIQEERQYLTSGLEQLGMLVMGSQANFIFFQTSIYDFGGKMREQGVLVRNCENYRGLDSSYYRVAVRGHEENKTLLERMQSVCRTSK